MLSADLITRSHTYAPSLPRKTSHVAMSGELLDQQEMEHIWLVTGPAGCGKTTVAKYLAKELSLPYVEGDDVRSLFSPRPQFSIY